jgi:hypothetical protein
MELLAQSAPAAVPATDSAAAGAAGPLALSAPVATAAGYVRARAGALPWPLAAAVAGATSIVVGLLWDISWHATIGRDTFWTPAHLAIHLGGILCGLAGGAVALTTTFGGSAAQRAVAVRFWGFRAPLGVWVAIWGTLAMLTSAPFDDWWHNAYGLDVKIISPPHVLLAAGILATQLGAMLQALAAQNRLALARGGPGLAAGPGVADGPGLPAVPSLAERPGLTLGPEAQHRAASPAGTAGTDGTAVAPGVSGRGLALVYAWCAGLVLVAVSTLFLEYSEPNRQHGALFYEIGAAAYPLLLVAAARAARLRWPATTVAALYMLVRMVMLWVLPLFPATPMLAPIYNPVRHMWPPFFPELLVFPAFAIDLILRRSGARGGGARSSPAAATAASRAAALAISAASARPARAAASAPAAAPAPAASPVSSAASAPAASSAAPAPAASSVPGAPWAASRPLLALALGAAFTAVFLAVHWPFADFMLSPHARNWFFAADQWTYHSHLGPRLRAFWLDGDRFGPATLPLVLLLASVSARLGLAWGDWMARVRR